MKQKEVKELSIDELNEKLVSFKKELSDLGFKIKETIIYKQKNNKLSDKQKSLIMSGEIGGIIFFSASVAKIFCKDIKIIPDGFLFFCISSCNSYSY